MTTTTLVVCLQMCLLGADNHAYATALKQTVETGKPLLVMVSTQWCGPCQQMKQKTLPRLAERGVLGRVAFAIVDADQEAELAQKITGGGPVPQLVLYRKTPEGWMRRKLIGSQSAEVVEKFIREVLESEQAHHTAPAPAARPAPALLGSRGASAGGG